MTVRMVLGVSNINLGRTTSRVISDPVIRVRDTPSFAMARVNATSRGMTLAEERTGVSEDRWVALVAGMCVAATAAPLNPCIQPDTTATAVDPFRVPPATRRAVAITLSITARLAGLTASPAWHRTLTGTVRTPARRVRVQARQVSLLCVTN